MKPKWMIFILTIFCTILVIGAYLEYSEEVIIENGTSVMNEIVFENFTSYTWIEDCEKYERENYNNHTIDGSYLIIGCILKEFYILNENETDKILDKYAVTVEWDSFALSQHQLKFAEDKNSEVDK